MAQWLDYRVRVTISDQRMLVGTFMAFDKYMNVVLADCEEFRKIKSKGRKDDEKEVKRTLGFVVLRGETIVSLMAEAPPPSGPKKAEITPGPGRGQVAGRGMPAAPLSSAPAGLAGPVRGVGGPAAIQMQPKAGALMGGAGMPGFPMRPPGMPGMMPPMTSGSSMTNGIGSSGTPLPSSKGNLTAKPKPGTVAAALQEKKESEKSRSEHGGDDMYDNHDRSNSDAEVGSEEDFRRGLTSEERVLLREKKKERLMKENESEQNDEGLNLSVSKNGGSEHTTKLEALLAKPIDDMPHHGDKGMHNTNGEPPRTEGV